MSKKYRRRSKRDILRYFHWWQARKTTDFYRGCPFMSHSRYPAGMFETKAAEEWQSSRTSGEPNGQPNRRPNGQAIRGVNEGAIFPKAPAAGGEAGRRHKNQKRNAKRMINYWYLRTKTITMVLLVSLL